MIISTSPLLYANSSAPVSNPYIDISQPMAGVTRFNTATGLHEIYTGSCWTQTPETLSYIGLSPAAADAILWAINKMSQEAEIDKLAKQSTAVKIAMDNFNKAKEQLDVAVILSAKKD